MNFVRPIFLSMKYLYPICIFSFLVFDCVLLDAQEKIDSLKISIDRNLAPSNFNHNWTLNYPTLPATQDSLVANIDSNIMRVKSFKRINYSNKLYSFPGDDKSSYTYSSNVFNFQALSDPLTINLDFHTKPILGLKKLDIYFFGNAIFNNRYTINKQGIYDDGGEYKRDLLWEIGSGIEYEYRESKFLFYDYSQFYENKGILTGKVKDFSQGMHKGGFRYKF
jgi:hypothetical protein